MPESFIRSHLGPREVKPVVLTAEDCREFAELADFGIGFESQYLHNAMDAANLQPSVTSPSILTPVQYLQVWLPGLVKIMTAARKIDELVGITTIGNWYDEEVIQAVIEELGAAVLYGDTTNVPFSDYNVNFERRTVLIFEEGLFVGRREEARAATIRVDAGQRKRMAAASALEISRNRNGFYGYNDGKGRTYGFLNDPALPAYVTIAEGASGKTEWTGKTFLEITADIRASMARLQTKSQDLINPESTDITLALPTSAYQYLSVTSNYGNSVRDWITETYPRMRIVSAPELQAANGGANVAYAYAEKVADSGDDDNSTFIQVVPAKFQALGMMPKTKGFEEDYACATAGVMCKRPYAVDRMTGL